MSISGYCCLAHLFRLDAVLCNNIIVDTRSFHIAPVDSALNILILRFLCDYPYFRSRHISHNALILHNAVCELLCFIVPAQCPTSGKPCTEITLFLLRKHEFQVNILAFCYMHRKLLLTRLFVCGKINIDKFGRL